MIRVADVRMSGQTIESKCRIDRAEGALMIKLIVKGSVAFGHNGQLHQFMPDSLIAVDPGRPFLEVVENKTQLIIVSYPKSPLRERGYRCDFNRWMAPNLRSPDIQMVREAVRLIAQYDDVVRETAKNRLSRQLIDLMDIAITDQDISRSGRTMNAARFRVKRYLAEHLDDEGLDASTIARGVNLSVNGSH